MKKLTILCVTLVASLMLSGCNKSQQINGNSLKTVNRSISYIKEKLPLEKRIEFEVSYWTLRDEIRDNTEFLAAIDGQTPEMLIEKGKQIFDNRKASGFKDYEQYATWEQMITQYTQERLDQNRKKAPDARDKGAPRVDYKMHAM